MLAGLLACVLCASAARAEIYKYRSPNGDIVFTDSKMKGGYTLMWHSSGPPKSEPFTGYRGGGRYNGGAWKNNRSKYKLLIDRTARRYGLHPELVHAVVRAESAYDPNAVSKSGATGLMQLISGTAARYGVNNRRDPEENVNGGVRYLRDLLQMFNYDIRLAVAGYNAGENAVIRAGNRIPNYPETQVYVERVIAYYLENLSEKIAARN